MANTRRGVCNQNRWSHLRKTGIGHASRSGRPPAFVLCSSVIAQKRWRTMNSENSDVCSEDVWCMNTEKILKRSYKSTFHPLPSQYVPKILFSPTKFLICCQVSQSSETRWKKYETWTRVKTTLLSWLKSRSFASCRQSVCLRGVTLHQVLGLGRDRLSYAHEWKIWSFLERESEQRRKQR